MSSEQNNDIAQRIATLAVDDVVAIITGYWHRGDREILDAARWLTAVHDHYGARSPHWQQVKTRLPFSASVTSKLVSVGTLPDRLSADELAQLPIASGTLYEISRLDNQQITRGIADRLIHPAATRAEVVLYRATCQADASTASPHINDPSGKEVKASTRALLSIRVDTSAVSPAVLKLLITGINKLVDAIPGVSVQMPDPDPDPEPEPAPKPTPQPARQPVHKPAPVELSSLMEGMYQANHGHSKNDRWVPSAAEANLGTVYEDVEEPGEG